MGARECESELAQLHGPIEELIELHEALRGLLDDERRALVSLDTASIITCAQAKADLARRIREAEERRLRAAIALAKRLGLPESQSPSTLRLSRLIEALEPPQSETLAALRQRLRTALSQAVDGQHRNRTLTQRFLTVLQHSFEAVHQALAPLILYAPNAHTGQTPWRGCVLSQTA